MGQSIIAGKSKEVILPLHSFLFEFTNLFILTVTFLYDDVTKVAAGGVKAFSNKRSSKYVLVNFEFCYLRSAHLFFLFTVYFLALYKYDM